MAGRNRSRLRQRSRDWQNRHRDRRRQIEALEPRCVLASGPVLAGITTNDGNALGVASVLNEAPRELVFRFDENQSLDVSTLDAIEITRAGSDGIFDTPDDVTITPGFLGLGNNPNDVVFRFAETLPDDHYRIDIDGTTGGGLLNSIGESFDDVRNEFPIEFQLNLGAQIVSVVPQPVTRAGTQLVQARDEIHVFFNDDQLNATDAMRQDFYQLIFTNETANNLDDQVYNPTSVQYDASANMSVLVFSSDLADLGVGTFRLKIGTSQSVPVPPTQATVSADAGSSFDTACNVGSLSANNAITCSSTGGQTNVLNGQGWILSSAIEPQEFLPQLPGSNEDPGHRQVSTVRDQHVLGNAFDLLDGVSTVYYNFPSEYASGFFNAITDAQKQRTREVMELYSHYLGVEFIETDSPLNSETAVQFAVATGDLRAIRSDATGDPDLLLGLAGDVNGFGPTAVVNGRATWDDSFGESWFQEAMRQVGSLLGLGAALDLPEGTIMGGDPRLTLGLSPEPVFPGNHDLVHAQRLYRPDSIDIDLYRFAIEEAGTFSAEIIAERAETNSANLLDSVLRLYRQTDSGYELISQNDDYFGQDAYLELELEPGNYFVGVSSKGNDQYDPNVEDSGYGGTSQGDYQIRLHHRPSIDRVIQDTTGVDFDGDSDGRAGGVYNFWFRVQPESQNLFVDKIAAPGGDGSRFKPYNTIKSAMESAQAGSIIRVVGNNLEAGDNDPTNDVAYEIGIDPFGQSLPGAGADGMLRVKSGVTLMIEPGTVFKLRRGAIIVGSASPTANESGAALQVLGTPEQNVYFTSFNDTEIGIDNNPLTTPPAEGDWGGIIFRGESDPTLGDEVNGNFVNYVNGADIRYGGGIVLIDAQSQVVNPITMIDTRPTITNNAISRSADAAIAASANSFEETNFHHPSFQTDGLFTSDYSRIGPEIHGNRLTQNTTNGMSIVDQSSGAGGSQMQTVSARWNDRDIVHVVTSNVTIEGTPGGRIASEIGETIVHSSRQANGEDDTRLAIDPGVVVKLEGARIEVGIGGTFIAEGTNTHPVVLTSLHDDRFGGGGSFDTNGSTSSPTAGDWQGIYVGHTGIGSFDNAVIAFGGGVGSIGGTFSGFNPIEFHQSDGRVTNSRFESNASGVGGGGDVGRSGRGFNKPGAIFVRGAQPTIVGNTFIDNDAPIVSADANSLNYEIHTDVGRQTGYVDLISDYQNNYGILVRDNTFTGNAINGMEVRGGTLTTESIWDDVDVTHVLRDGIFIPNFHTYGGLRLQSSVSESLVVKLLGDEAGFRATGSSIAIPDHIGGRLQVLGQPGRPVILTSLYDDTVGAGLDPSGNSVTDTNNGGRPVRSIPISDESGFRIELNFGPALSLEEELVDAIIKSAQQWEQVLQDQITISVDVQLADLGIGTIEDPTLILNDAIVATPQFTTFGFDAVRAALINDAGPHESIVSQIPDLNTFNNNVVLPRDSSNPYSVEGMRLTTANAKAIGLNGESGVVSQFGVNTTIDGTITLHNDLNLWDTNRKDGLFTYREDLQTNVMRALGTILGFDSSVDQVNAGLNGATDHRLNITPLDLFRFRPGGEAANDFTGAARILDPRVRDQVFYAGGEFEPTEWDVPDIQVGEVPLSTGLAAPTERNEFVGAGYWKDDVLFRQDKLYVNKPLGIMDPVSQRRDQIFWANNPHETTEGLIINMSEQDRLAFDVIGYDVVGGTPGDWKGITLDRLTHDRNAITMIEEESPIGAAPGANGAVGTGQNLGTLAPSIAKANANQHLALEVRGLLNAPNDVDYYSFEATAGTQIWLDIDRTTPSLVSHVSLVNELGNDLASTPLGGDLYSYNPNDGGAVAVLPGTPGSVNTYFVKVRSDGITSGAYQLQLRLTDTDEVPGTTVAFADIRYADTGIQIIGPPISSPLTGEHSEDESFNDTYETTAQFLVDDDGNRTDDVIAFSELPWSIAAQDLGNLLNTDTGALSVFGSIYNPDDIDWFEFRVGYDGILDVEGPPVVQPAEDLFEPPTIINPRDPLFAGVVFDIDYADGLSRPSLGLAVYDDLGTLIYYSNPSGGQNVIPGDQSTGNGQNLGEGSFGSADPFIGPVQLPASYDSVEQAETGFFDTGFTFLPEFEVESGRYYVVVFPTSWVPGPLAPPDPQDLFPVAPPTLTPVEGDANRGNEVGPINFSNIIIDENGEPIFTGFFNAFGTDTSFVPSTQSEGALLEGEYQLEIRYVPVDDQEEGFNPSTVSSGDVNRERDQGQISIEGNTIRNSRNFGIVVEDAPRDLPNYLGDFYSDFGNINGGDDALDQYFAPSRDTNFTNSDYGAHATPIRSLTAVNEERLVPGLSISNNLIYGGEEGALQVSGDPNGIVLQVYDIAEVAQTLYNVGAERIDGSQFTVWDHQRHSRTFEFDANGAVVPGNIPIRFDFSYDNDCVIYADRWEAVNPPTAAFCLTYEVEHALRISDLDIVPQRTAYDEIYIEGAVEIGHRDVHSGSFKSAFGWPLVTAFVPQQGPVPFVQIVNNTLVGRGGDLVDSRGTSDVGILVEDNASPTILNNVIANFETALKSDLTSTDEVIDKRTFVGGAPVEQCAFTASTLFNDCFLFLLSEDAPSGFGIQAFSIDDPDYGPGLSQTLTNLDEDSTPYVGPRPTVIGANVFQGNLDLAERLTKGDDAILLGNNESLFVDASLDNFLLASGSRAIDSAVDALDERSYLATLLNSIGAAPALITAPDLDAQGLQRIDDPLVEPPSGFGRNTFKDRGALERADFSGPRVRLISPADNTDGDINPQVSEVFLLDSRPSEFRLQLIDGLPPIDPAAGTGPDDRLVTQERFTVMQDGAILVPGVDYSFTYDQTSDVVRLAPLVGNWPGNSRYEVLIDRSEATGIRDLAGNLLEANQTDGTSLFAISLDAGFDFGDAPNPYPVTEADNGARHRFVPSVYLGAGVDVDRDGQPSNNASFDVFDDGIQFDSLFLPGSRFQFTATASVNGLLNLWADLNGDGDWDDPSERLLANRQLEAGANDVVLRTTPHAPILEETNQQGIGMRFRFSTGIVNSPLGEASDGEVEDYFVAINSSPWQNPVNRFDVDANGAIVPFDALLVINELNGRVIGSKETGLLPIPPIPPHLPVVDGEARYVDVDGDGFVSPIDALQVINELPSTAAAPLGSQVAVPVELRQTKDDGGEQQMTNPADSTLDEPATHEPTTDEPWNHRNSQLRTRRQQTRRLRSSQPSQDSAIWNGQEIEDALSDIAEDVAVLWKRGNLS